MWVEGATTAISTAKAGMTLFEHSALLKRAYRRLAFRARRGKLRVPIFGAGGVGKTTCGSFLAGTVDPAQLGCAYQESIKTEKFELPGDVVCQLSVAPGQQRRVPTDWPMLLQDITNRRSKGVINVVAYGYHSFELQPHLADITAEGFLSHYTARRREIEVQLLERVVNGLSTIRSPLWMITVVNKQDLWWNIRDEVRRYYEQGPYMELLVRLQQQLGEANFRHEFVPTSLVMANLIGPSNEILAPVQQGYDHAHQIASMTALTTTLLNLGTRG